MEEFESGHPGWRAATASRPSGNLPSPADAQRIHTHKKKKRDKQRDSAHNTPQEQREHKHKKKKRDRHQGDTENRDSVGSGSRPISPTTYKLQLQSSFRPTWAVGTPIPVTEKGLHQSGSRAPHHATPQQRPAPASSPFTPFDMLASSPAMEQASPAPPGQKKRKKRKSSDVEAGALDGERKKKKKKHRQSDATDGPMPATIAAEPSSSTGGRGDGDGPSLPQRPIRVTSPLPAGTSRLAASAGQDVFTPRKIHPVAHHPINPSSLPYPTSNPSDMHPTTSKIPSSSNVEAVNPDGKRKKKTKKKHLHTDSVAAPALQAAGGAPGGSTSLQQAVSITPSPITPFESAPSSSPDVVMRPSVRSVDQQLVDPSLLPGSTSAPSQLIPTTSTLPPISDAEAGNTDGKKKKKKKKKHRHFDTAAGPVLEPAAAQASSPAAPLDGDDTAPSPQQPVRNTPPPAADPVPSTSSSSPRMSTRSSMRPVDDHWSPRLIDPALLPEPEANPSDIISTTSPASAGPSASKGTAAAKKIGRPTKRLDEASLRSTIRTKEDAQRYLATTWLTWSELKTFESLQLLDVVKGKFALEEERIARAYVKDFQRRQVLSDDELAEHIHAMKAQTYGNFWSDLAALLPGRPLRGIHPWIKRLYDPRAGQGKWTAAEDAALHSAHERTPGDWKAIAQAVGRPELSCRDRFRDRVSIAETRKDAREWTQEDLDKLWECVETIKDEAASSGSAGIPWTIVMERMGGIASRETLRTKWEKLNRDSEKRKEPLIVTYGQTKAILVMLKSTNATHASQVQWDELAKKMEGTMTGDEVEGLWIQLRLSLIDYKEKTFQEIVESLIETVNAECAQMETDGESMESVLKTNRPFTNFRRKRREEGKGTPEERAAAARQAREAAKQQAEWKAKRLDEKAERKEQNAKRRAEAKARKLAPKTQRRAEKMAKAQRKAEAAAKRAAKAQQPVLSKEVIEDSDVEAES